MSTETGSQIIQAFIDEVWRQGAIDALSQFWTDDCVNPCGASRPGRWSDGPARVPRVLRRLLRRVLRRTRQIIQQVEQDDRVVTQLVTSARHTAEFAGVPATGKPVTLATIRIDRLRDGKIAEHWSVADVAGVLQQLQS